MEGGKHAASSPSSFTSDLFGSKEPFSSSSSSGIFGSIFALIRPSSTLILYAKYFCYFLVFGRESLRSDTVDKKKDSAGQAWNAKPGAPDAIPRSKEGESHSPSKKDTSSFYTDQRVQPCHLSSSIYYGGQDIYSNPQTTQSSGYSTFNKDGGEDDSGSASRGNWWQGGLYY